MKRRLTISIIIIFAIIIFVIYRIIPMTKQSGSTLETPNSNSTDFKNEEKREIHEGEELAIENTYFINIKGTSISPIELNVNINDVISWINEDSIQHKITLESSQTFNLPPQKTSGITTYTQPGIYKFILDDNPSLTGTIVVH